MSEMKKKLEEARRILEKPLTLKRISKVIEILDELLGGK